MTAMLSAKELACLYTKLEAPVTVADLLDRATPLSDDESFALTIMLSEMTPQQALISIACCTQIIASRIESDAYLTSSLTLQANFILDDYAPLWLRQQRQDGTSAYCDHWNVYMQEDLEAMADLLMICSDIFGTGSVAAAEICTVLQDQALAHAEALNQQEMLDQSGPDNESNDMDSVIKPLVYTDNIIQFPVYRRAS